MPEDTVEQPNNAPRYEIQARQVSRDVVDRSEMERAQEVQAKNFGEFDIDSAKSIGETILNDWQLHSPQDGSKEFTFAKVANGSEFRFSFNSENNKIQFIKNSQRPPVAEASLTFGKIENYKVLDDHARFYSGANVLVVKPDRYYIIPLEEEFSEDTPSYFQEEFYQSIVSK